MHNSKDNKTTSVNNKVFIHFHIITVIMYVHTFQFQLVFTAGWNNVNIKI